MFHEILGIGNYPLLKNSNAFRSKVTLLFKIYGIILLFSLLCKPLYFLWESIAIRLHYKSFLAQYQINMRGFFTLYGYWGALIYISIIGPIIEEMIFRLPLSFKPKHIAIAFGFLLVFLSKLIPGITQYNLLTNILIRALLFSAGYCLLVFILPQNTTPYKKPQKTLILTFIISFGLLHILNYIPLQLGILFLYPLYVIPQLLIGWLLTYVRFKNGFAWGVVLHIMINSLYAIFQIIYKYKLH
jgi:hypothetical protein